jgi:serine phosphatase RsbU (regulator of sigma subunit)
MFGKKAICPVIRESKNADAGQILDACLDELADFHHNPGIEDDMTLIVAEITE